MAGVIGADPERLRTGARVLMSLAELAVAMQGRLVRAHATATASTAAASAASAEAYWRVPALVSELADLAAAAQRDALLLKDRALRQTRRSKPAHTPPVTAPVESPTIAKYRIGPPSAPSVPHHNHFPHDPSQSPTLGDYVNRKKWVAYLWSAKALRPDLKDGTDTYHHYWFGDGQPLTVDYEKAYQHDAVIRRWVDRELGSVRWAAEGLHLRSGQTSFQMTGDRVDVAEDPATENWQKTLGQHHMWVSADVRVDGDRVTVTATVHARDWYNFNPGARDLVTGEIDDSNGRFATLGWAKEFETHATLRRTMTWTMGAPEKAAISGGLPHPPVPSPAPTPLPASGGPTGRR